jgi:dTDP-glucose pyrophosphorylase
MLETIFLALKACGVSQVCIVINHLGEQIRKFAGDGKQWRLNISYVYQEKLIGTADAVRSAADFITESCYILAADYALPQNFILDLQSAYIAQDCPLFISLKTLETAELSQKSSLRFDGNGRIAEIVEKPPPGLAPSNISAAPFMIVPVEIRPYLQNLSLSPRGEYEIMDVLNQMAKDGYPISGFLQPQPPEWT